MPASLRTCKFRFSFRYRLLLIFTLLTAVAAVTFSTLHIVGQIRQSRRNVAEQLRLQAENMADAVRLSLYAGDREALKLFVREAAHLPQLRALVINAANGVVLAEFHANSSGDKSEVISETVEVRGNPMGLSVESALSGGQDHAPVVIGSMRLERGTADLSASTRRMMLITCCMALAFWLLVTCFCNLVLRRVTRSFNSLMLGVERMRTGDFTTMIEVESNDEPGRAALAINALSLALREREEENGRLNQKLMDAVQVEARTGEKLAAMNLALRQEVVERSQAEQAVRNSEQHLRMIVDAMPVGVVWSAPDGTLEYVNNFVVERSGYGRDECATEIEWFEHAFPDPDYRARITELRCEAISRLGNAGEHPSFEARVTCKDGTVRHVLFTYEAFLERRMVILVDITERELFQEQLIKTQKLESLGVLAGGIAHNFNNILTGVIGYISFARKFLDESHKSHAVLEHAENASYRAAAMANQLLTFARGGAPVKRPVSVARLVEESLLLSLNGTNVQSVVDIPESVHAIKVDEGQLSQALNNIIINAVQAMPAGGKITVRAENVIMPNPRNPTARKSEFVRISFIDEGEGIPKSILPKIFDPYFTTKPTATGLGLASVHSIIQKHGGLISLDSEPGKGTTFAISLPSAGETLPESDTVSRKLTSGGQGGGRILVMDDEEMIREFAMESLEFLGYQVLACANGEDAVNRYMAAHDAGAPFFAVILDLTVPDGMGGVEASQQILAFDPSAKLIVSSGYSYDPIMADYQRYGFCAAVTKPYKVDQLDQELKFLQTSTNAGKTKRIARVM